MSELGNRSGALLPTLMESWEQQHSGNLNGRRLLPSPGSKKVRYLFFFSEKIDKNCLFSTQKFC